ncbi:MAG: rRNA maturation RNase YbeY [Bacteroidales bacterium]|nr:rRNA maturation RNase YbeY [Bacteroidales bacterium]
MILFHSETSFLLKDKRLYKSWLKELAQGEGFKIKDLNYIFCDDEYLLKVNLQYLQHDTLTDIITFDYVEGQQISGDVFISVERVRENAALFGVTFEKELLRVLAHGVLHLCGYKDKSPKDAALMRNKEEYAILLFDNLFKKL